MADHEQASEGASLHIIKITSHSGHPIRNTSEDLIFGDHVLWDVGDANSFTDKRGALPGSMAPNAFIYDFQSPLENNSTLHVTIKAIDERLVGGNYLLRGTFDTSKFGILESKAFVIETQQVTIDVCLKEPRTNPEPLAFNGLVSWTLMPSSSSKKETPPASQNHLVAEEKTHLELYWIAKDIHEIFLTGLSGIYVDFLRGTVLSPEAAVELANKGDHQQPLSYLSKAYIAISSIVGHIYPKSWSTATSKLLHPQTATRLAYYNYCKVYHTTGGASSFGLGPTGGTFFYRHYIAARRGGQAGSMYPVLNCYDQAAMVQVTGTVGGWRPSWLLLDPYGFINATYLVGIRTPCNNPFYPATNSTPYVNPNDTRRTPFARHAFNGHQPYGNVYDATGGPHLGHEDRNRYCGAAIDYTTGLYRNPRYGMPRPGYANTIRQCYGVTGTRVTTSNGLDGPVISKAVEEFLHACAISNAPLQVSQVDWDTTDQWVKSVFGSACEVAYHEKGLGEGVVEAVWQLMNVNPSPEWANDCRSGDVLLRVKIQTRVGTDGKLDYAQSSQAALHDLAFQLTAVQLYLGPDDEHLDNLWSPTALKERAQYAVQYKPDIKEGRFLVACGNVMIDITGGPSSAALEPYIRTLLNRTSIQSLHSPDIPHCTRHSLHIPESSKGVGARNEIAVKGLCTSFDVKCQMDGLIATASADVENNGLLLSKFTIDAGRGAKTSTVTFTLVTRSVGTHVVDLRFGSAHTMSTGYKRIRVTVTEGGDE